MKTLKHLKYEGMGFVEALIAILVVGVSSVVLMQIASQTLKDMIQNETIDTMTQHAVEGSTMVQNIAMQEQTTAIDVFPNFAGCYVIDKEADNQYSFRTTAIGYTTYDLADRNTYQLDAVTFEDPLFFRIFCIDNYLLADKYIVVKIVVGQTNNADGTITKGNSVKDYTYFTVANL